MDASGPLEPDADPPAKTIIFPNVWAASVAKTIETENKFEEARLARRNRRNANGLVSSVEAAAAAALATTASTSRTGSVSGTPGPGTPAGERAPDPDAAAAGAAPRAKPLSKKQQKIQNDARASQAQSHATANAANMALGGSGGPSWLGGKKISWMTSKSGAATNTSFGPKPAAGPRGSVSAAGAAGAGAAPGGERGKEPARKETRREEKGYGSFREDRESGRGIQLRDVLAVLETEGQERKALLRLITKLNARKG